MMHIKPVIMKWANKTERERETDRQTERETERQIRAAQKLY